MFGEHHTPTFLCFLSSLQLESDNLCNFALFPKVYCLYNAFSKPWIQLQNLRNLQCEPYICREGFYSRGLYDRDHQCGHGLGQLKGAHSAVLQGAMENLTCQLLF